jgi:V8-like Glu-specific endopeptidase
MSTPVLDRERIGADDRHQITATLTAPFRWVCSLDVVRGDQVSRGSGLLVGPRHVLTAAHNVYDGRGRGPDTMHVAPARNGRTDPVGRYLVTGTNTTAAFFRTAAPGTRSDFALLTLEKEVGSFVFRVTGDKPLGWWGHPGLGAGTALLPLDRTFLENKGVVVCGFPGDKCGSSAYDESVGCETRDRASTMWWGFGTAHVEAGLAGILLHDADTHPGQSGSPVWIKFTDGSRRLAGIHVAPNQVFDAGTLRPLPLRHNRAVHFDADVAALVRD